MEWNAKTDPPPSGPKLKQILDANTELDGPREARTQLKEKVDKIRELGATEGDEKLLRTHEVVCKLAGWSTPDWAANQEVQHQGEMRAQKAEVKKAQHQL